VPQPFAYLIEVAAPSLDWQTTLDFLLGPLGLTVGLLLVVLAFVREWVVPGPRYRQDTEALREIIKTLTDQVGDVAKATEDRNRNEQARLDLLRGSQGLSGGMADAEDQIMRRPRRPSGNERAQ
jgi:hypothetical protein